ncbi:MAG: DUF3025 domain-containing protein [Proteobacteria bacterium]|nr:DUF3025 domain-containing protein [Pseudomonadota bacterium]
MTESWDPKFYMRSPMFAALTKAATYFSQCTDWPELSDYNAMAKSFDLRNGSDSVLAFVAAKPKPRGRLRRQVAQATQLPYEERIYQNGEVSTRLRSWHDFFNALVWATYPKTKAALNQRQHAVSCETLVRGREQDRLAMFDEGGLICLQTPSSEASVLVFGHALFESYMHGRVDVYGMTHTLIQDETFTPFIDSAKLNNIDADMAECIRQGRLWNPEQRPGRALLSTIKLAGFID